MMLCTAPKKKNSSLGIAVSVFIDIVSLTGKFSYRSYFLPARGPTMFIQMRIKIRRKQRGKIT